MKEYCEGHIKLCEDVSYIKAKVDAIDKRINGSIDDIKEHVKHSGKWRISIMGVAFALIMSVIGAAMAYGKLCSVVEDNAKEIETLRKK